MYLSLKYNDIWDKRNTLSLPAIGAGAPVRLARLRSRMDLDFFHFLVPIN
jgi:hypothetical protein